MPSKKTEVCRKGVANCSPSSPLPPTHMVVVIVDSHHPILIVLIVFTTLALVAMLGLLWWKLCGCRCCKGRRKRKARYKQVSKFFPSSYWQEGRVGESVGVALPEFGVPKPMPAERELMLSNSDEDSI